MSLPVPHGAAVVRTTSPVPGGLGWQRPWDPGMRVALVSSTQLAHQHFRGSHDPSKWPHMEAGVARPGGEPAWELARATVGARTLTPLSVNCGSWSWSWRPLIASLTLRSLIFQSEEGENIPPLPPGTTSCGFGESYPL